MKYTPEDEKLLGEMFDRLINAAKKVVKSSDGIERIERAYFFAKEAHKGIKRRTGEPYMVHPLSVALIVVEEIGLGSSSIVAALLHDVVEDTEYTIEDIETIFGEKTASMVDGLTKMSEVDFTENTSKQEEDFRKMLITLSDDVRVIIIKIADRLHNMRTLGAMPPDKQYKVTSETMYLFAPLSHRLGLYAVKTELEDLSLKYRFPEEYRAIEKKLADTKIERDQFIEEFIDPIRERLREGDIDFEMSGRVKSVYSVWSKMQRKQVPFEEVYDLFAIRIVFNPSSMIPEKTQAWHIYSIITDIYNPKPDRIRDWLTLPKANGYEALHATVMGPGGVWVEVQIRSERMDAVAERGFAAHWKYKQGSDATISSEDLSELDRWLGRVRDAITNPSEDARDFLDNFKMTLYTTEIVVFTPKGEPKTLPSNATVLDFAFDIHTNVGLKAIGAKINHKIESIYTQLSNGDQVEILSSDNTTPTSDWLEHVTTAKAKQAIRGYLKKDNQNNIQKGIELFEEELKKYGVTPSARVFRKVLPAYDVKTKDEFYSKLGVGMISLGNLGKVLRDNAAVKTLKFWTLQLSSPLKFLGVGGDKKKKDKDLVSKIDDSLEFSISECCNPIPGDEVIGFKNPATRKIDVHKPSCEELTRLAARHGDAVQPIEWSSHKAVSYLSEVGVRGIDRVGILMELAQLITGQLKINIRELHIQSHDGIFEGKIAIYVQNTKDLRMVIDKVSAIKGMEEVKRIVN